VPVQQAPARVVAGAIARGWLLARIFSTPVQRDGNRWVVAAWRRGQGFSMQACSSSAWMDKWQSPRSVARTIPHRVNRHPRLVMAPCLRPVQARNTVAIPNNIGSAHRVRWSPQARDAEIDNFEPVIRRHQHVLRLDVAVHQTSRCA